MNEEAARFRDVHEERLTHRLEAFSDIVLGFSLAEMTLNFAIPPHAIDVYNSTALAAFAFTFLVVSLTWYTHHRLFEFFFVPRFVTVFLNFVVLGLVMWLVYQLQIYIHFANSKDHNVAAIGYCLTFAVVWLLLAVQFAICGALQWKALGTVQRRNLVQSIGRTATVGLGTLLTVAVLYAIHRRQETTFWFVGVWALLWRLAGPAVMKRIS